MFTYIYNWSTIRFEHCVIVILISDSSPKCMVQVILIDQHHRRCQVKPCCFSVINWLICGWSDTWTDEVTSFLFVLGIIEFMLNTWMGKQGEDSDEFTTDSYIMLNTYRYQKQNLSVVIHWQDYSCVESNLSGNMEEMWQRNARTFPPELEDSKGVNPATSLSFSNWYTSYWLVGNVLLFAWHVHFLFTSMI